MRKGNEKAKKKLWAWLQMKKEESKRVKRTAGVVLKHLIFSALGTWGVLGVLVFWEREVHCVGSESFLCQETDSCQAWDGGVWCKCVCLPWRPLCCFLKSHLGFGRKWSYPNLLSPDMGDSPHCSGSSHRIARAVSSPCAKPCVFFLWRLAGILKGLGTIQIGLVLWNRAFPPCWWKAFGWHLQGPFSLGRQ